MTKETFLSKGTHGNPALGRYNAPDVADYPKWITPHESHVQKLNDGRMQVVGYEFFVDRDQRVTVLVKDEEDETKMLDLKSETNSESSEQSEGKETING